MAHPALHTARTRQLVIAGLAGTVVLCAAPATALTIAADEVSETCHALDDALDPMCDVVEDTTGAVQDVVEPALAPVIEPVEEAVEPVAEALPTDVLPSETAPLPGGADAPAVPPAGETPGADAPARPGGSGAPGPATNPAVEAAGKAPEEIHEPQGPASDGRITGTPTLQPADLGALGSNIAGYSSDSGLTLQPYDSPMVSIPTATAMDTPRVAGAPVMTASPVAAMAAEAMAFTGDVVLPQTGAEAAMVTATGVGLLAGAAYIMRRRVGMLSLSSLDDRILGKRG